MKEMRTFEDFVVRYWIVLLGVITLILLIFAYSKYGNAAAISGISSFPWYLRHKEPRRNTEHAPSLHHPFIKKILSVFMFEFIFNRNRVIPIDLLKENGVTSGQISYATTVLKKKGVVKNHNAKHLKLVSARKAREMEMNEIFKGIT